MTGVQTCALPIFVLLIHTLLEFVSALKWLVGKCENFLQEHSVSLPAAMSAIIALRVGSAMA